MRHPEPRSKFRRDFKREGKGIYRSLLHDGGEYEGSRECHIRPDLLLIYTLEGDDVLWLERLGSHAELFGM